MTSHTHAPALPAEAHLNLLCQHEYADGGLCAYDALPDETRCAVHRDDDEWPRPIVDVALPEAGGNAA